MTRVVERQRPARPGEMRCPAGTNQIARDRTGAWEQRCALPLAHEGGHRFEWEEIEEFEL